MDTSAGPADTSDGDDLLALALSQPAQALERANRLLGTQVDPLTASYAHHAAGIVLRDRGDLSGAVTHLRRGVACARRCAAPRREADIRATLGLALAWAGRSRAGLVELNAALENAGGGLLAARVMLRRASLFRDLGRFPQAMADLERLLPMLRAADDQVWEARALLHRAEMLLMRGATARARADNSRAELLFQKNGQDLEHTIARHNRALFAVAEGDLPAALRFLHDVDQRYAALGTRHPDLDIDRCNVLLAAALAKDALREADVACAALPTRGGTAYKRAELLFTAARAALAIPDPSNAVDRAARARRLFAGQDRPLWQARAELVLTQARFDSGRRTPALLRQAEEVAERLDAIGAEQAQRAHLLAGRLALGLRRTDVARRHLDAAALTRRSQTPLVRSLGWLARALQAEARADHRAVLRSTRAGLAALAEHRARLGASELRAYASAHGSELAAIALREEVKHGTPRRLLTASEQWRSAALLSPPQAAPTDPELNEMLVALRAVALRIESARESGPIPPHVERERRHLESAIRDHTLRASAGTGAQGRFDLATLRKGLGERRLIELLVVGDTLQVLTVVDGRVRRHELPLTAPDEIALAVATVQRAASAPRRFHTVDLLARTGQRLQEVLLGPAVADLGDDAPVVLVPPATLHTVPWALLPALRHRAFSVAPSATAHLKMAGVRPPRQRHVSLIVGPGLATRGRETKELQQLYPQSELLVDGGATVERALASLDGAWLAHVAAHGEFRADNPQFSALRLDDGPLTVHDLERLRRAPYRFVLSSCSSGVAAAVGNEELLGVVSSLIGLGSAGVVASILPVNDEALVPLMEVLHQRISDGAGLAEAMLTARSNTDGDPVGLATGVSFLPFGI